MKQKYNVVAKIRNQRGFTIIELGIVLALALAIIGVSVFKGPAMIASYKASAEVAELGQIIVDSKNTVMNRPNWTGVTLNTLIRNGDIPENRTVVPATGAATAANRWGGAITFASGTIGSVTGNIGRLNYASVPAAECRDVVLGIANNLRRVFVDSANSGTMGAGTEVKADGAALNEDTLGQACGNQMASITCDIPK